MDKNSPPRVKGQGASSSTKTPARHETEPIPDWVDELETRYIRDYTDVNQYEKRMMIMWNLHVTRCNVTGDVQIPWACRRFVELQGKEIAKRNLYRNFCLHITNLFDLGLLSLEDVRDVIELYHSQGNQEATQPMEMSCDDNDVDSEDEVTVVYQSKPKSSYLKHSPSNNERSPLKRLSNNLDECEADERPPSKAPSLFVSPPSPSKYRKKTKREKFPSYDD